MEKINLQQFIEDYREKQRQALSELEFKGPEKKREPTVAELTEQANAIKILKEILASQENEIDYGEDSDETIGLAFAYFKICQHVLASKDSEAGYLVSKLLTEWDTRIIKEHNKSLPPEALNPEQNDNQTSAMEPLEDAQKRILNENEYGRVDPYIFGDIIDVYLGAGQKRDIIDALKDFKDDRIVTNLVDFLKLDSNGALFLSYVCEAINQINPEKAVGKLLKQLHDPEKYVQKNASAALYRLEFGRIGISEEGVHYLEHWYDLGEYNNPNFHVSRLTADGDIGIFNQDLQLIKFFQLGDLSTPEKKTRAAVYDFVYETLFIGKKNETKEERDKRMQYLEEFKQNYYTKREQLEKESGVILNNLSFKEQGWFIIYFIKASPQEKEQIYNFIKNFGEEGIKTFLSLEGGEQNGQIILELGKILEHNTAKAIFTKFVEVARYINLTGAEISRQYLKNNKTVEPAAEIIRRAGQILVSKHKKMQDDNYIEQTPENKRKINEEIINDLENIKVDTVVFSAMFKTIFETYGGAEFQEVVGLDLEHKNKKEFTFEDQEELKEFIAKVYAQKPAVRDYVIKKVHEDFLSSETGHWYLLRRHGKLIATMRFNKLGEEIARATSFMVDPQLQTSAIGKAMEKNILDVESANKKILAVAEVLGQPISHYIEKNNWLITGFYIDKDSGIPFFEIMRDDYNIAKYSSRNFSNEEILQISEDPDKANELNCLVLKISSIPNEFDQERIKTALEQGFVTTRFLRGENFGSNAYLVFEKNKTPVQLEEKKLANFSAK